MDNYNIGFIIIAAVLLSVPAAVCQGDAGGTARNNAIGDAYEVTPGQTVQDSISAAGELDFYKFYIDSSGIARIKVADVPEEMTAIINLFNKNGERIDYITASNAGDPATLVRALKGPGWHYIQIQDNAYNAYSSPYSLSVSFDPAPDQYEPNDVIGDATGMDLGGTVSAYICPVDDNDFYKVQMTAPGVLMIKVKDVPEEMVTVINLFDKNGDRIAYITASNPGDPATLEKGVSETGLYYIQVFDNARKAYSEPYTLSAALKDE